MNRIPKRHNMYEIRINQLIESFKKKIPKFSVKSHELNKVEWRCFADRPRWK